MTVEPTPNEASSLDSLLARCTFAPAGTRVVCALSGGPDSTALVALAVARGLRVEVVHVDHGLRASSGEEAQRANEIATRLGASFHCEQVEIADGPNLEARARTARRAVLGPDALTGHTADDQAETLLLALLRGSGSTGLGAMTPSETKPILALRRAETHDLCAALGITAVIDPSNRDPRFRRNRIRNELLPLAAAIADRDPTPLLNRTSNLLRDDDRLLDELSLALDPTDAAEVAAAPLPLARRAIRRWTMIDGYPPDAAAIDRVLDVARGESRSCDVQGGHRVVRSHQRLKFVHPARSETDSPNADNSPEDISSD